MTTFLIIIGSIALTAGLFGMPKTKANKSWKPKKPKKKISWEDRLGLGGDFWDYAS